MDELLLLIQQNVTYAPYIIFGALLLAGFNIPVSEDAMLFISAVLAKNNPDLLIPLFLGVYLGAYLSDLICYWLGRLLGPRLFRIRFFARMVTEQRRDRISLFYRKYGIITLLLGRFIPFGVRNGLFLTAGLGQMPFARFALADLTACTITTFIYFTLYYRYGSAMIDTVKRGNLVIFGFAVGVLLAWFISSRLRRRREKTTSSVR